MHPKLIAWDRTMKQMLDRIDHVLENRYGHHWKLRHNRPRRGETSNPQADGLFDVDVIFTPGYRSRHGRGYLVEIIVATDQQVTVEERAEIELLVLRLLREYLPEYFPGRELEVVREGAKYKIVGNFKLGRV